MPFESTPNRPEDDEARLRGIGKGTAASCKGAGRND